MDAISPVRKSVAYKCGVSEGVQRSDCVNFLENDLVVLLDIALHLLYQE